jgi:glycerol-3-phosphate acyltransferase PlsX
MRIALDAMGGDDAPRAMVQGAVDYARAHPNHTVILVGREPDILAELAREGGKPDNIAIEHAPQVIGMAEKLKALEEKPDDSMNRCAQLVKQGKADALVLCGNTGCSVGAAQIHLRRIPGVKRAGILTRLPKASGYTWICDCGANAVGKPEQLVQFAEMTVAFLQVTEGRKTPSVGVLSIGEEDEKGNPLTGETLALLRRTALNVIGNVEGNHIYQRADLDVVVCDGFTGNIVLKTSEGVAAGITQILKEEIAGGLLRKLGALLMRGAFAKLRQRTHWSLVGGGLLLGVDGVTIIGHGRSNRVAVYHALRQAALCVDKDLVPTLRERFKAVSTTVTAVAG